MTSDRPVSVVVVAYGRADLLERCLVPVAATYPVVVVDNSSQLAVRKVAEAHGCRYVDPGENRGFGAGVNVALRELLAGPTADVLLLNPDAVITAEDVDRLAAALHRPENARVAVVTPTILVDGGREQRALWPFPSPARAWLEALGLGRFNRARDFAVGTVPLLRWEALQDVGLFDEQFFLYAEETDWQRRARSFGWRAAQVTEVVAQHVGGGTSSHPARREQLFHAGTETYVRKWFGSVGWAFYRAAVVVGALPRAVLLPRGRREGARQRARLYLTGPRRAAGLGAG